MPNFPSIYLELQELWKRLRRIEGLYEDHETRLDSLEDITQCMDYITSPTNSTVLACDLRISGSNNPQLYIGPNATDSAAGFNPENELLVIGKTGDAYLSVTDGTNRTGVGATVGIGSWMGSISDSNLTIRKNNQPRITITGATNSGLTEINGKAKITNIPTEYDQGVLPSWSPVMAYSSTGDLWRTSWSVAFEMGIAAAGYKNAGGVLRGTYPNPSRLGQNSTSGKIEVEGSGGSLNSINAGFPSTTALAISPITVDGSGNGSNFAIVGTSGTGTGDGGHLILHAGNGQPGGEVRIFGGKSTSGAGGDINIVGGVSTDASARAGDIRIESGDGNGTTKGGDVFITGIDQGMIQISTINSGGHIRLLAGGGPNTRESGVTETELVLQAGTGNAGEDGRIVIWPASSTGTAGHLEILGLPSSTSVTNVLAINPSTGKVYMRSVSSISTGGNSFTGDVDITNGNLNVDNTYGIYFGAATDTGRNTVNSVGETLQDYEHGTWSGSTTGFSAGDFYDGNYVKIGPFVWVTCRIYNPGAENTMDIVQGAEITGLPWTAKNLATINNDGFPAFISCGKANNTDDADNVLSAYIPSNTNKIIITTDLYGGHENLYIHAMYRAANP